MRPWIAAGLAGCCLGLAPIGTPLGHLLWLIGVVAMGRAPTGRPIADTLRGALLGGLWYGLSLRWVALSWVDLDGSQSLPVVSWLGVTVVQAVVPAVGTGLAGALLQRGWPRLLALPIVWVAASTVAPWVQPLPGGLAVYGASLQPLLWPAAWLGLPGFVAVAGAWSALAGARPLPGLLALALWAGVGLLPPFLPAGSPLDVGLVQPNTGPYDARRASTAPARADKLLGLIDAAREAGAALVVTPETAWPYVPDLRRPSGPRELRRAFSGRGTVVLGLAIDDGPAPTNSLLTLVDGEIAARQDKIWLVPVSEQRLLGLGTDRFRAGKRRALLDRGAVGVICYEDLVPAGLRNLGPATWVIAASNDAWLGPGPGARQHENAARLGAVRSGRWLVRPTANGRSAVFDPQGRRVWSARWVDGDVRPDAPGEVAVVRVHPRRPVWSGADLEPWSGLIAGLLALIGLAFRGPWPGRTDADRGREASPGARSS